MKKVMSLLLAIVMAIGLLPTAAFAAETDPTISFDTTFEDTMTVGDTFTVTASLANNPGMATMTLSLKWNEDVVKFTGFATEYDEDLEEDILVTDVFKTVWEPVVNYELGIIVAARAKDTKKEGTLFVANFEVVGSGELGIGLKDTDRTEFEMVNAAMEVIEPTIDYSAIENLSVAGGEDEGPAIPDGAPFTAITTDAGNAIAIEQQENVSFNYADVPYYIVTIPADAATVYVTAPDQVVMEDYNTGAMQATGYAAEVGNGWNPLYISYNYEDTADGPKVEIPMNMVATDWSGEVELCFVEDEDGNLSHAFGIEDSNYACLGLISFRYGEAGGEEAPETYSITIDPNLVGGSIVVKNEDGEEITEAAEGDLVILNVQADSGYQVKSFGYYYDGQFNHAENSVFYMPAGEITVTATFTEVHNCTYEKEVVDAKYLKTEATCQSGAVYYKSCVCGKFATTADTFVSGETVDHSYVDGACKWCGEAEPVQTPGYRFATSADVTAENGGTAVVHVKITGHSDENVTSYNAYDVTLTFDDTKLEYVGYDGAVKSDNGSVTVSGNTIRIVGCGADKDFGTEIAALTFKTKAEGAANVTISKVQVSDKEESVKEDAPEATPKHDEDDTNADETPDVSVVVVPYSVTKPDFVSGNDKILHGEDYTFFYTDTTNYTYSELTVTVGGVPVTPTEANGVYTIENVTGAIVITATQTPNSYDVTKPENVTGPDKATYGEDYIFTVTPSEEDMAIDNVKVTDAEGNEIPYTINENGEYVIEGTDITGEFTITVTEKEKMTTVTFSGIEETEIEGGLTQSAEIGKDFTFQLIKEEGYDYTVKVGETELTESEETAGQYTIPAELVVKGGVAVAIEKVANTKPVVDVAEYISLDGKVMFLVTAKWGDRVLAYGEDTMYWSDKYTVTGEEEAGAYCWLVLSTDEMNTAELVKAAAEAAIVEAAEGATATAVKYNYDINGTTKVDVNDAQLAYDMYNASYMEFTDNLPMLKFLEADMETDGKLDTKDVTAIISYIVSGANA